MHLMNQFTIYHTTHVNSMQLWSILLHCKCYASSEILSGIVAVPVHVIIISHCERSHVTQL